MGLENIVVPAEFQYSLDLRDFFPIRWCMRRKFVDHKHPLSFYYLSAIEKNAKVFQAHSDN